MSRVLVIVGSSSSGKTTLARAVRRLCSRPAILVSLDDLIETLDPKYRNLEQILEVQCNGAWKFNEEHILRRLFQLMMETTARATEIGIPVVAEHVCYDSKWTEEWKRIIDPEQLRIVRLTEAMSVIEAREKRRSDRPTGLASAQLSISRESDGDVSDICLSDLGVEWVAIALACELAGGHNRLADSRSEWILG